MLEISTPASWLHLLLFPNGADPHVTSVALPSANIPERSGKCRCVCFNTENEF